MHESQTKKGQKFSFEQTEGKEKGIGRTVSATPTISRPASPKGSEVPWMGEGLKNPRLKMARLRREWMGREDQ